MFDGGVHITRYVDPLEGVIKITNSGKLIAFSFKQFLIIP